MACLPPSTSTIGSVRMGPSCSNHHFKVALRFSCTNRWDHVQLQLEVLTLGVSLCCGRVLVVGPKNWSLHACRLGARV